MKILFSLFAVLTAAWVSAGPSSAQVTELPSGTINSRLLEPIPENQPIAIEFLNNTELDSRLADEFRRMLAARGYTVAPRSSLVLEFETETVSTGSQSSVLSLEAKGGSNTDEQVTARLNIPWGPARTGAGGTTQRLSVRLALDRKVTIWRATATATVRHRDRFAVGKQLVWEIVDVFGEEKANQRFVLN